MQVEQERHIKTAVKCEGISKTFETKRGKTYVIEEVSLEVIENEFVVLFGPGQCGKTTLLNILAGLIPPTKGMVVVNGKPVISPGPERGFVFQSVSLFPWLTVMGNVEYGPKVRGIDKETRQKKAQYYIDLVGLKGFENAYPNQLSGGMKQRVGIARAYCNEPVVMFLDEPFGALDAQTRYLMQEELIRIWETEKRTVLFVTNNIEEAVYLADRIILLTNSPVRIKKEFVIDLPRPRDYTSEDFLLLRNTITKMMDKTL
ncbi:MAG TPA: ABC transporter ATP-binding protein [Spirochaetales bacterium]|nr:ABC transporter ATP-binding protein [Spirochaetales bacterium]